MDVKKKMAELIAECFHKCLSRSCTKCEYIDRPATRLGNRSCQAYLFADHLIANGVTVQESKGVEIDQFNKWIPVTERLPYAELNDYVNKYPEDHFEVLVVIKGAKIPTTLCFEDGEFYFPDGEYGGAIYPVTHWMPLPEPPKGE